MKKGELITNAAWLSSAIQDKQLNQEEEYLRKNESSGENYNAENYFRVL